jgi:hypothetical protein
MCVTVAQQLSAVGDNIWVVTMDVYAKQGEATNLSRSSRESSPIKQERLPHATRYKKKCLFFTNVT